MDILDWSMAWRRLGCGSQPQGQNAPQPWSQHHKGQRETVHGTATLDLRTCRQPVLEAMSSVAPHGFQNGEFFPPKIGSTTPEEQPGGPWHAPDHPYHEKFARESRHILSHAGWLDANGNVNFYSTEHPTAVDERSRGRTPRKSPSRWRGGAWPALPGTASANRLVAEPSF